MLPSHLVESLKHEQKARGSVDVDLISSHPSTTTLFRSTKTEPLLSVNSRTGARYSAPATYLSKSDIAASPSLHYPSAPDVFKHRSSRLQPLAGNQQAVSSVLPQLPAMIVNLIMCAVYSVTYGSLLFSAPGLPDASYLPDGIALWLLNNIVGQIGLILVSALPCAVCGGTLEMLPIFHAMFSSIAHEMHGSPPEAVVGTILATCFVSTLSLGLLLMVGARFGVANYLRAVPLVVLKGALFGVAIFCFQSVFEVSLPPKATVLDQWEHWGIPAAAGSLLFVVDEVFHSTLAIPTLFVLISVAPSLLHFGGLYSFEDMRADYWIFPTLSDGPTAPWYERFFEVYTTSLPYVHWKVVVHQLPGMLGMWVTHALISLMDIKATEIITGVEVDLTTEIRAVGAGNVLSALAVTAFPIDMPCSSNVSAWKLGGGFSTAVMSAVGQIGLLFVAQSIVPCLPRALPAATSWWLGLLFGKETLVDIMQQHAQKYDIIIVVLMAVLMLADGFVTCLLVGLLVAMGLFTIQYSGSPVVIQAAGDARFFRSNVHRPRDHDEIIRHHANRIHVIHVSGHVMFGSSPHLVDEVKNAQLLHGAESVVLNFRGVQGLDYSGALDLLGLGKKARLVGNRIFLTELSDDVKDVLRSAGVMMLTKEDLMNHDVQAIEDPDHVDLDQMVGLCFEEHYHAAVKLCEDCLLESEGVTNLGGSPLHHAGTSQEEKEASVWIFLRSAFGEFLVNFPGGKNEALHRLRPFFEVKEYQPGITLWKEDECSDKCVAVVDGMLDAFQVTTKGTRRLCEVITAGSFSGYTAFVNQATYLQTLVSSGSGQCMVAILHREKWEELLVKEPMLSVAVLRGFVQRGGVEIRDLGRLVTCS